MNNVENYGKDCKSCMYFVNCLSDANKDNQQCQRFPSVPGYCVLWEGPLVNYDICTGFVEKKQ